MMILRVLVPALSFMFLLPAFLFAAPAAKDPVPPKAVFSYVKGKVEVKRSNAKAKPAAKGDEVKTGDRITAAKDSSATLRFLDGTELRVRPRSEFRVERLSLGDKDKSLKFKLFLGKVIAKVKKLTSSRSSFEIEAGGVVCGVRGTEYSVDYDPEKGKLRLEVMEGEVFADGEGKALAFKAGEKADFLGGKFDPPGKDDEKPGKVRPEEGKVPEAGPDVKGASLESLNDMSNQLGTGALGNGDEALTDPGVKGGVPVNVQLNLPAGEIP